MANTIGFDPATRSDDDCFALYHDLYRHGSTVNRAPGRFHATVKAVRLPRLLMFERRLSGLSHARDAKRVSRDGFDHLTLQVVFSGSMQVVIDDVVRCVTAGEAVIFDNLRPQQTVTSGVHSMSLSIARDAFAPRVGHDGNLHGLVLTSPHVDELIGYVRTLCARSESLPGDESARQAVLIGRLIGETLIAARGLSGDATPALLSSMRGYSRVLAFLDANAGNRNLTVAAIAERSGVSRSALYRLFEPVGGVAAFIMRQRLLRLRRSLLHDDGSSTVGELAAQAGFASPSHAVRRFRMAFGTTPLTFRREHMTATDSSGPEQAISERFTPWFEELI